MVELNGLGGLAVITSQGWWTDNHCLYMGVLFPQITILTGLQYSHIFMLLTVFTHIYVSASFTNTIKYYCSIYGYKRSVSFMKPTPFAIYQHWRRDTPAKHNKILVWTAQMVIF